MRMLAILFCAAGLACGPAAAAVGVSMAQPYEQVLLRHSVQFQVHVSGTSNTGVIWEVNNVKGGTAATGKVSATGLFTAPRHLPVPAIATVTAISKADPSASATATVTLLARAPTGGTYYVATTGDDNNPGTITAPWRTIQHAASTVGAGDTVLVRGGVYSEHVAFTRSGNATNGFISFESYPGETAIVDGTGLNIPHGQWGLFTFQNASYAVAEGFELRNYTTASIKQVPIGIYVFGAGSNVQLVNNRVHDITTTAATTPAQCGSNAFGITVYGTQAPDAIDALAISGNEVFNLHTGCSETLSLDGNVTNFAVVSNIVHDDDNIAIGAIGFEKVSPDPAFDQARAGVIRGNTVYNITSFGNPDYGNQYAADGIYVDGGTNIVIEQNLIHNADLGIELASEHDTRTSSEIVARNNVIYDGQSAGISIGGYGARRGGTDHCTIVNNTLFNNDTKKTGSGEFQIQFNATNNVFQNNILYAGAQSLLVNDFTTSAPAPAMLDNNLYFDAAGSNASRWVWQKKSYRGLSAFQSASGQDAQSPGFADPQFVHRGTSPNLKVRATSPALRAGALLGASITGTSDFEGLRRTVDGQIDLGAYER